MLFSGLLADGLQDAGYTVTLAPSVAVADAALAEAGGQAVLVADRSLAEGGPNGFQFAASALDRYAALGVIYISGTHIAIRRRTLGTRERALLKPFAMSQLLTAVRGLMA